MRKLYLFFIGLLFSGYCYGQQDPLYAQYLTNPMIFNPAYVGLNNSFNAAVSYRNQWAGFNGSPSTVNFSAHTSVVDNKVGLGAMFVTDKPGLVNNTELEFLGSYKLNLTKYTLSFGMQLGYMNSTYRYFDVSLANPNDPVFPQTNTRYSWPNLGVGAILKGDQFIVGVSVPRMMKTKAGYTDFLIQSQHIYVYGAYVYYLGTRLRLKPSVLFRGVKGAPLSTDLNFNVNIDTKYSGGIFLRNFKSYGVLLQAWFFNKARVGYAFELPGGSSVGPQYVTNEITLAVRMGVFKFHDSSYTEF
ncbi:MAG TPA: PorP/SprF family type IX secretion system membrane protein [Cyclobacteriaceae bacterium]|nr:PorP/SprF family type IX secretion system membrane protein [Cyclobacteriaceae bacterium]